MTNAQWFLLIGCLLLARGLTSTSLNRSSFTPAIIYLAAGILVGPSVLNVFYFDPLKESALLEILTEVAVLISLFSAGVKMPVPVSLARWRPPLMLAWGSMTITVAMIAGFSHFVLDLPLGAGILLGAILAPTDPVLATDVQSRHPGDSDQLRFTLTCEAGMNDGTAFPFVMLGLGMLGLHEIGEFGLRWIVLDVLWATVAAIAVGVVCGAVIARIGWKMRGYGPKHEVLDDLVGLGLIAVAYGISVSIHAWGFLAIFFAGVALRQAELNLAQAGRKQPARLQFDRPNEAETDSGPGQGAPAIVSEEALVFQDHLERLSELLLVLLLGGMLFLDFWTWRTIGLALFVFMVARPLSVFIGLLGTNTSWRIRGMTGWFGVRGIGSIYYLMHAIQQGLPGDLARELIHLTLIVITLSILVHGTSVKPLMNRFWKKGRRTKSQSR
jgi:NhaP-type Na+/H+ or K+/H+ antiporter